MRVFLPRGYTGTSLASLHIPHLHLCFLLLWESFLPTGWGPLAPSRLPGGAAPGGFGAGGVQGAQGYSPVCRVCLPPESTPRGRVPVGVRPLRVSTLSLSSLQGNSSTSYTLRIVLVVLVQERLVGVMDHGNHGARGSLKIGKTSKVTKSNHQPSNTIMFITACVP